MRVYSVMSDVLFSSSRSPQYSIVSPLLFVLSTNECQSQSDGHHILKSADDSVSVSFLSSAGIDHGPIVSS